MHDFASFWAVDLHTHTPASKDVNTDFYGGSTPEDVVQAAIAAGLSAIAITDHNTTDWCDEVSAAAAGTSLVVLPGVEISTTEGHLLGIWEAGTSASVINETLVRLGIGQADRGKLDITAEVGFASAAQRIAQDGGIAIAAHIDAPKGLLKLPVPGNIKDILLEPSLSAVEIVDISTAGDVERRLDGERDIACIRSSDTTAPGKPMHVLSGIGTRRTWIKAARPDLVGIRHALRDNSLRVRLEEPQVHSYPKIEKVALLGGFLDGTDLHLSPDMNCLMGGTGAGKSLILEAVRYAVDQQVAEEPFPAIWEEVRSRMIASMGDSGVVQVTLSIGDDHYMIERVVDANMTGVATVHHEIDGTWVQVDVEPTDLIQIEAFSQGEALEYSRQPVGRMSLIDTGIDLSALETDEEDVLRLLRQNGDALLEQRKVLAQMVGEIEDLPEIEARVEELSKFFAGDKVKQQEKWKAESAKLKELLASVPTASPTRVEAPSPSDLSAQVSSNADLFETADKILTELGTAVDGHLQAIDAAFSNARQQLQSIETDWKHRFDQFTEELERELSAVSDGANLRALRFQLDDWFQGVSGRRR